MVRENRLQGAQCYQIFNLQNTILIIFQDRPTTHQFYLSCLQNNQHLHKKWGFQSGVCEYTLDADWQKIKNAEF